MDENETPTSTPDPVGEEITQTLQAILDRSGIKAKLELQRERDGYYVNIHTRSSDGLLIGKRGETLRSLQYLVKIIARRKHPEVPRITIDVGGYRMRRENFLRKKALAIARIVLETHREMALDPLTDKEREAVEQALSEVPGVRTYTIGSGIRKNVIVAPA